MLPSPTQVVLVVVIAGVLAFGWYAGGGRWRARVSDRLLYGIPWGTLVIVGINVVFYLLVQGGLQNFESPVVLPFVSWSYFYPLGMATAGIAHGSASHIIGNMAGTLVFAPIAEYVWGHHPPAAWGNRLGGLAGRFDAGHQKGVLQRPWVRAVVIFPGIMLAGSLFTSLFSLGPGIGFSGVVFGIIGFAIVTAPLAAVVAVVATSALGQLVTALRQPIVRAGIEAGAPGPPAWANIGFQAHMLGFLIGVLLGVGLLVVRERRPAVERVFFATVLVGLVQSLWLISLPEDSNTFVLYRGAGTVLVLLLSVTVAVAAGGSSKDLPRPLSALPRAPTRRQIAVIWLLILGLFSALGIAGAVISDESVVLVTISTVLIVLLLAGPAIPPLLPDRLLSSPISRRQAGVGAIVIFATLVGLIGVPYGFLLVDGGVGNSTSITVEDYQIAYVDNGTTGHSAVGDVVDQETLQSDVSGVVVVSDQREIWTTAVQPSILAHQGNTTVSVGGVGWRKTVDVERRGWSVVGNESAYVVDLIADGERTRSYTSAAVKADVRVDDHSSSFVPAEDGFDLRVTHNGSTVGTAAIPEVNGTATAGPLDFVTENKSGEVAVFAESDGTRVRIGTREN